MAGSTALETRTVMLRIFREGQLLAVGFYRFQGKTKGRKPKDIFRRQDCLVKSSLSPWVTKAMRDYLQADGDDKVVRWLMLEDPANTMEARMMKCLETARNSFSDTVTLCPLALFRDDLYQRIDTV